MSFNAKQLGKGFALAALIAATGAAHANGGLGNTATGSLDVLVGIADRVQLSGLNDIDLGTYDGTGGLNGNDTFCVYRNGTGAYSIAISSANGDNGSFRLAADDNYLGYSVTFADSADLSGAAAVTSGDTITGLVGSATSLTCGNSSNAALGVSIAESDLQAAVSGNYSDTITLLVTAE